ncbi:sulfotransferase [Thiocystis violacea]|uniref:sulfotransferase n=1 Tax=Thiocystis violacea TaxID=13725 RepID=UPI00190482E3|nr:sulfotransferase [Thiocystis violacea]MBK1717137.1 sulfotransferase family protein [Thiocystis violacea]
MPLILLESLARFLRLIFRTYVPGRGRPRASVRRLLVMSVFIPCFALIQGIQWIGLLLDEILFPAYRRVAIREPLFVLGVPRSGTTHLHHVLARDPQYTTFSTWECLFALSISARRFWLAIARLDARLGRPLAHLLGWMETHVFGTLEAVHPMRLGDPEEDYFALMPVLACFILILPFPNSDFLWRMGTFDRDMPEAERARLMDFYHRCLQRHLYVHGPDKRLLSKNAAFAPLAGALAGRFPDARFILCLREPERTLPSQLSSIASGIAFFDSLSATPNLGERLTGQLGFYYRNLQAVFAEMPDNRRAWVTMETLKAGLEDAIEQIHGQLELEPGVGFRSELRRQEAKSRDYRSRHQYRLEPYGLSLGPVDEELGFIYAALAARSIQSRPDSPSRRS